MRSRLHQLLTASCLLLMSQSPGLADTTNAADVADTIPIVNDQFSAKKYSDALTTIENCLKRNPEFTQFYLQKGYAQLKLKQYDEALLSLNHCLKVGYTGIGTKSVDSLNAEVWIYIGHCKLAKGEKEGAKAAFRKGLALYPGLENGFKTLMTATAGSSLSAVVADRLELVSEARKFISESGAPVPDSKRIQ